jgi:hypothetical protein
MPDTDKNAQMSYNGNGSQDTFLIDFNGGSDKFLNNTDIIVKVSTEFKTVAAGEWDFDSAGTSVVFTTGNIPPVGVLNVVITRETPHPALHVTFTDSAPLTAAQLTQSFQQSLYYTEEVEDQT